jgi:Mg-chelatase subunit ChlD
VEVALIAFFECGDVRTVAAFTTDPNEILKALEPIQPSGGTPLAEGIGIAKEYLRANANSANKRLVVLTDGAESCQGDLVGAARK